MAEEKKGEGIVGSINGLTERGLKKTQEVIDGLFDSKPKENADVKKPQEIPTQKNEAKTEAKQESTDARKDLLKQHILGKLNAKIPDLIKQLKDIGAGDDYIKEITDKSDNLKKTIEACANDEALRKSNTLSDIKVWIQDLDNISGLKKKIAGEFIADAKSSLEHIKIELESGKMQDGESLDDAQKIASTDAPKTEKQSKKDFVDSLKKYGIPVMAATSVASVFGMFGAFTPSAGGKEGFFAGIAKFFSDPAGTIKGWFGMKEDKKDKTENPAEYASVQKGEIKDDVYSNAPISVALKDKKIDKIKIGNQEYKIQSAFGTTERLLGEATFAREDNCDYLKLGNKKVNLSKLVKTAGDGTKPEDEYILGKGFLMFGLMDLGIEKVA